MAQTITPYLCVADVDGFVARAEAGGAIVERPAEESNGSRNAWLKDPFGHRWNVCTPLVDRADRAARRAPAEPYYLTMSTPDVERAARFYGAVLGWEFSEPNPEGGRHVTSTRQPIGVRGTTNRFGTTAACEVSTWWIARDFDDAVARVRAAGGSVESLKVYDSGREAICRDDQNAVPSERTGAGIRFGNMI